MDFNATKHAFHEWLNRARADFSAIANLGSREKIAEGLAPVLGSQLVENAANAKSRGTQQGSVMRSRWSLLNPAHKQALPWGETNFGKVSIKRAQMFRNGFRWQDFSSGGPALPKNCDLRFEAETNVSWPYSVYWQVVNTGTDAQKANGLRGGFEEGQTDQGRLTRKESTLYKGSHTIEYFIIKGGLCVARSGLFIVNIQ